MPKRARLWEVREDYRPLLRKVKNLFPTVLSHVKTKRIALAGLRSKSSSFMAKIYSNHHPWCLLNNDYDYLIVFWSTQFDERKRSFKYFVMLHELAHIPNDGFVKGHPSWRKLRKHDIEDFRELREVYGLRLEKVKDVLKGEQALLDNDKKQKRFPRGPKIA